MVIMPRKLLTFITTAILWLMFHSEQNLLTHAVLQPSSTQSIGFRAASWIVDGDDVDDEPELIWDYWFLFIVFKACYPCCFTHTLSTLNCSHCSATRSEHSDNKFHIWYTSLGLSPSQAWGFGKPWIRAWLRNFKAQAHQSQAQYITTIDSTRTLNYWTSWCRLVTSLPVSCLMMLSRVCRY